MDRVTRVVSLLPRGPVGFEEVYALQKRLEGDVKAGGPERLLLLEHRDVITMGRNADRGDLHVTPESLAARGIELVTTDRGGKLTFHGPGQLVAYPILDLSRGEADVRRYVRRLEEALILTAADFGVLSERSPVPERWSSIWVGNEKLAAIGVHLSRWVTTHGAALNVSTDLSRFSLFVPCGIRDGGVTSLARCLAPAAPPGVPAVAEAFVRRFGEVFERRTEPDGGPEAPAEEALAGREA